MTVIDSDEHLSEPPGMWAERIDPQYRDDALELETDDLGYTWLTWRGRRLLLADVQNPGHTEVLGDFRQRQRRGEPVELRYTDALPAEHTDPAARVAWLDTVGLDAAVCFPNFGLSWGRRLDASLPALTANMRAWNRWCTEVVDIGGGRLHPVGHVTLRDPAWLEAELRTLASAGIRLAMMAPAVVDGRPLSHPDHERLWSLFEETGITPVFHVADQPRVFDDCWFGPDEDLVQVVDSVFLWVPAALALTDLILNGVFDRHPNLRFGIVELSSIWVPQWTMMLDGGTEFCNRLNGRPLAPLAQKPSDYFRQHVRVSSFSYELPARLIKSSGDIFMACSDFPHSEGTAHPLADYEAARCAPADHPAFFADNVSFLLNA